MYRRRLRLLFLAVVVAFGILALRLLQLQVLSVSHDYAGQARSALYRREETRPRRGDIRARNGLLLAADRVRYDLVVPYQRLQGADESWVEATSRVTGVPPEQLRRRAAAILEDVRRRRMAVVRRYPGLYAETNPASARYRRIREEVMAHTFVRDVSLETVARVEVAPGDFGGARIEPRCERIYPEGRLACHVLGHTSPLQAGEERSRLTAQGAWVRFREGDLLGRSGLEYQYDDCLRGTWGLKWQKDNVELRLRETILDLPPVAGATLYVALDPEAQRAAEAALEGHIGAAVLMDVHTGEVLVMASSPGYDVNRFAEDFERLSQDTAGRPFINRAIQDPVRLGSVIKIVLALAGLESGSLALNECIECRGTYVLGQRTFSCVARHGHGNLDVIGAIERSCNVFFYVLGRRLGPERIVTLGRVLGLGRRTGIDLPYESAGRLPDPQWKAQAGYGPWYPGDTLNLSIGEGDVQVTPIQTAVMVAAVANGGRVLRPRLFLRLVDDEGRTLPPPDEEGPVFREVQFKPEVLATVREGMRQVVFGAAGTAHLVSALLEVKAAGKTGSAEVIPGRLYHAWFAGYAPYDRPRVACAVAVHRSPLHGGEVAATIAAQVLQAYFRRDMATVASTGGACGARP